MKDYLRHETGRMFENGFLEAASRVHPATPFLFYIPIITALEAWALSSRVTTVAMSAAFLPLGWVTWQLMEYALHRAFFHWEGSGPFTRRLHDIIHGYHHHYPDDDKRLVMPLGASIPLAIVIVGLLWIVGRPDATVPYFVGIVGGYLWYDFNHWATHYRNPKTAWGRTLRSHHMAHHFADHSKNFGISHRWIDRVMGTLKKRDAANPR
ncbi:MAG: sterol desaturase family protein [Myxococcaceae bacterium]